MEPRPGVTAVMQIVINTWGQSRPILTVCKGDAAKLPPGPDDDQPLTADCQSKAGYCAYLMFRVYAVSAMSDSSKAVDRDR